MLVLVILNLLFYYLFLVIHGRLVLLENVLKVWRLRGSLASQAGNPTTFINKTCFIILNKFKKKHVPHLLKTTIVIISAFKNSLIAKPKPKLDLGGFIFTLKNN
jgi:hypothetical protein